MNNKNKINTFLLATVIILLSISSIYLFYSNYNMSMKNDTPVVDIISPINVDTDPVSDRVPSRFACVGEFCDGSGYGDMSDITLLQIPLVTSGGGVGCGSKIFFAPHTVAKTSAVLDATYKLLFDIKVEAEILSDDIRNPIGSYTKLSYKSVTVENGVAKVMLTGNMYGPGHCSYPEIREQINQSAFQFDSVSKIEVYLNGKVFDWCSVSEADPAESKCDTNPRLWIDIK